MTEVPLYNGKNLQHKFLDWKWPPLPVRNFSENSSVFEGTGFPYVQQKWEREWQILIMPHLVKLAIVTNILQTQFQHSIKKEGLVPCHLKPDVCKMWCLYFWWDWEHGIGTLSHLCNEAREPECSYSMVKSLGATESPGVSGRHQSVAANGKTESSSPPIGTQKVPLDHISSAAARFIFSTAAALRNEPLTT